MSLFIIVLLLQGVLLTGASASIDYKMSPAYDYSLLQPSSQLNQTVQIQQNITSLSYAQFRKIYQDKATQRLNDYYFANMAVALVFFGISLYEVTILGLSVKKRQVSYIFFTIYSHYLVMFNYLAMSLFSRGEYLMKLEGVLIFATITLYILWTHIQILRKTQKILSFDIKAGFAFHAVQILVLMADSWLQQSLTILYFIQSPFIEIILSWTIMKKRYVKSEVYQIYQRVFFRSVFLFYFYEFFLIDLCPSQYARTISCMVLIFCLLLKGQKTIKAFVVPKIRKWLAIRRGEVREDIICAICLQKIDFYGIAYMVESIEEMEQCKSCFKNGLVETQCGHVYHVKCICSWVKIKAVCPVDNKQINQS